MYTLQHATVGNTKDGFNCQDTRVQHGFGLTDIYKLNSIHHKPIRVNHEHSSRNNSNYVVINK